MSLAKYYLANETMKQQWRNIIIEVPHKKTKDQANCPVRVINAATSETMNCQMPQEMIDSNNERVIAKFLREKGLNLCATKDVKIYLLGKKL